MLNNNQSIRWSEKLGIFKMTQIYIESIIEMKKISHCRNNQIDKS
jgi:hypothetical protein